MRGTNGGADALARAKTHSPTRFLSDELVFCFECKSGSGFATWIRGLTKSSEVDAFFTNTIDRRSRGAKKVVSI